MKTAAEIANHPKARLHRELIQLLRAKGSMAVVMVVWREIRHRRDLWKRVLHYGLASAERQSQLNCIAFPEHNHAEVEAALQAGNSLRTLYELASGRAWVARDHGGNYKRGRKGLRVFIERDRPSSH